MTKEEVHVFARVCLSVCLSVSKITRKHVHEFGWNVACRQLIGTWTNWLTFEPDPMPAPDCFLRYRIGYGTFQPRLLLPASCAATRNFTSGKSDVRIGRCSNAWFYNGFIHWAGEPSKHLCRRYMRSTECPSSFTHIFDNTNQASLEQWSPVLHKPDLPPGHTIQT